MQGAGKVVVDVRALDVDLLTLSAHKIYGPKGVGCLYVRRGTPLAPLVRGGGQERNRRAGTENVAGIVGFGAAAALARESLPADAVRVAALRDRLEARLLAIPGARRNGEGPRVPNTTNVSFEGVEAEELLIALDLEGHRGLDGRRLRRGRRRALARAARHGPSARAGPVLAAPLARPDDRPTSTARRRPRGASVDGRGRRRSSRRLARRASSPPVPGDDRLARPGTWLSAW